MPLVWLHTFHVQSKSNPALLLDPAGPSAAPERQSANIGNGSMFVHKDGLSGTPMPG